MTTREAFEKPEYWEEFEKWWETHGQYCRAGGGEYEKSFAWSAFEYLKSQSPISQNEQQPKQIPDGYSTEDEHFASTLEELAEQFLSSYEAGDVITVHLSKDLGSQDYKYCFDATGKPFLEPTNTEVGE